MSRFDLTGLLVLVAAYALWACDDGGQDRVVEPDTAADLSDEAADVPDEQEPDSTDLPEQLDTDAAELPSPPSCAPRCEAFRFCEAPLQSVCTAACDAPDTVAEATACINSTLGGDCAPLARCLGLYPSFSTSQPGTGSKDLAGDFTLQTTDGPVTFSQLWTGQDNTVFLIGANGYAYAEGLWAGDLVALLKKSPLNSHFFVLAYADQDGTDNHEAVVAALQQRFVAALPALSPELQAHWPSRFHFVLERPAKPGEPLDNLIQGWLGDAIQARGTFAFGIDRSQRLRNFGLFSDVGSNQPKLERIANELLHFNFEWTTEARLAHDGATVVNLADKVVTDAVVDGFVDLPNTATMANIDGLEVVLRMDCLEHDDPNLCGEWDYLAQLHLCDPPSSEFPDETQTPCPLELARWVTPYAREGLWTTDITGMLAAFPDGGRRRLRFSANKQPQRCDETGLCWDTPYVISLDLRLSQRGQGARPVAQEPLFNGQTQFDELYNSTFQPLTFTPPPGTQKVELYALITGHGFGADLANCAEFCNHQHAFDVNGHETLIEFPGAGTRQGCEERVVDGVSPNQFGTWPLGRGGWCPGWDVRPFVIELTDAVDLSGPNTVTYRGLYQGADYTPELVPPATSSNFRGTILLNSRLIYWQ